MGRTINKYKHIYVVNIFDTMDTATTILPNICDPEMVPVKGRRVQFADHVDDCPIEHMSGGGGPDIGRAPGINGNHGGSHGGNPPKTTPKSKTLSRVMVVCGVIVLTCIIILILYFVWQKYRGDDEGEEDSGESMKNGTPKKKDRTGKTTSQHRPPQGEFEQYDMPDQHNQQPGTPYNHQPRYQPTRQTQQQSRDDRISDAYLQQFVKSKSGGTAKGDMSRQRKQSPTATAHSVATDDRRPGNQDGMLSNITEETIQQIDAELDENMIDGVNQSHRDMMAASLHDDMMKDKHSPQQHARVEVIDDQPDSEADDEDGEDGEDGDGVMVGGPTKCKFTLLGGKRRGQECSRNAIAGGNRCPSHMGK